VACCRDINRAFFFGQKTVSVCVYYEIRYDKALGNAVVCTKNTDCHKGAQISSTGFAQRTNS